MKKKKEKEKEKEKERGDGEHEEEAHYADADDAAAAKKVLILKNYLMSISDDLSQFGPNCDNSVDIIDLTVEVENPAMVFAKLLNGEKGEDAVQVINVYFKSKS